MLSHLSYTDGEPSEVWILLFGFLKFISSFWHFIGIVSSPLSVIGMKNIGIILLFSWKKGMIAYIASQFSLKWRCIEVGENICG